MFDLQVTWIAAEGGATVGAVTEADLVPWEVQPGASWCHRPASGAAPALTVLRKGNAWTALLRNGRVLDKQPGLQLGTLKGRVILRVNGAVLKDELVVSIPDGTDWSYTQAGPGFGVPGWWVEWMTRDVTRLWTPAAAKVAAKKLAAFLSAANPYFQGGPGVIDFEPDAAGSAGFQGEYCPTLGMGPAFLQRLGLPIPPIYRAASVDWCWKEAQRPACYTDEAGGPLRFSSRPDLHVDEQGWTLAAHGSVERKSLAPAQLPDIEHYRIFQTWVAAVGQGLPHAWLLLDHWCEALCSRPVCRDAKASPNLRGVARTIKALALGIAAFGERRPQFKAALKVAVQQLRDTVGAYAEVPYLGPAPAKIAKADYTHVKAVRDDAIEYCIEKGIAQPATGWPDGAEQFKSLLEVEAVERGLMPSAFTIADDGLYGRFRAEIVPWEGLVLGALGLVHDVQEAKELVPDLAQLALAAWSCIDGPGRWPSIGDDGAPIVGAPCFDSYAWRRKGRARQANIQWGGTQVWIAAGLPGLLAIHPAGDVAAKARELLLAMRAGIAQAAPGYDQAVSDFFPAQGMAA